MKQEDIRTDSVNDMEFDVLMPSSDERDRRVRDSVARDGASREGASKDGDAGDSAARERPGQDVAKRDQNIMIRDQDEEDGLVEIDTQKKEMPQFHRVRQGSPIINFKVDDFEMKKDMHTKGEAKELLVRSNSTRSRKRSVPRLQSRDSADMFSPKVRLSSKI